MPLIWFYEITSHMVLKVAQGLMHSRLDEGLTSERAFVEDSAEATDVRDADAERIKWRSQLAARVFRYFATVVPTTLS